MGITIRKGNILLILLLLAFKAEVGLTLELDPSNGLPVFLADPDSPNTYTSTYRNPLIMRLKEGTVTIISNPIWITQPKLQYYTFQVSLPPYGTYSKVIDTTFGLVGYDTYIEYYTIGRNGTDPLSYLLTKVYVNISAGQEPIYLVIANEATPANPVSIVKPPIPIYYFSKYKIDFQNKSSTSQNIEIGVVTSYRKSQQ